MIGLGNIGGHIANNLVADGHEVTVYDIDADRVERHDLAAQHPEVVARLAAAWERWATRASVDRWTGPRHTNWGDPISP